MIRILSLYPQYRSGVPYDLRGMSKAELVDAMDKAGLEAPTERRTMLPSGYD